MVMKYYYAPIDNTHKNLQAEWNKLNFSIRNEYGGNFWTWIEKEYKAILDLSVYPERFKFENSEDCVLFILRWS